LSSSRQVKVYKCVYTHVAQLFSRHHIAGYALCELYQIIPLEQVKNLLSESLFRDLLRHGEILITDEDLIKNLLREVAITSDIYLRLTLSSS